MNLSYWEYKTYLSDLDFTVVGGGIVGLSCALELKKQFPDAKVLVLEKGTLPSGASTKNAGFACYGSISELVADLESHSEEALFRLVRKRWEGIQVLRENLGDKALDFKLLGGHELFLEEDSEKRDSCLDQLEKFNQLLEPVFKAAPFIRSENTFGFKNICKEVITHRFEGQLDTGGMMRAMIRKASAAGILLLNGVSVQTFEDQGAFVALKTDQFEVRTRKLCIATNGFASQLLNVAVKPARAQVIITTPLPELNIRGTFHLDEGYYYFRNIDNRILIGGGRNLDLLAEETTAFGLTEKIQRRLEKLLRTVILPGRSFEIESRWSGIMGVGDQKMPIVKAVSGRVFCAVRLGGMGVAIGSIVGKDMATKATTE